MSPRSVYCNLNDVRRRFGWGACLHELLHKTINKFVYFDCFHIVALDRGCRRPLAPDHRERFSSSPATREQLLEMSAQSHWWINDVLLRNFEAGDICIISYVDGVAAGYTWAHVGGMPELIPGLTIRVPSEYVYNYAGMTLPDFRGSGLQAYRHHSLLDAPQWQDRQRLLGYVRSVNFASRKGQAKGGYRRIGSIWMAGRKDRFATYFSASLRRLGIVRIDSKSLPLRADHTQAGTAMARQSPLPLTAARLR